MKRHVLKREFSIIADIIIKDNKSLDEWAEIESDDMFQEDCYVGGFDRTEMEFCFSYYDETGDEYWFQISLDNIIKFSKKELFEIELSEADY